MRDIKSIILFALLTLVGCAQSAIAASIPDGFYAATHDYRRFCVVSSGAYGPLGPLTHVYCSVGEGTGWYSGNVPNTLNLFRRENGSIPYISMTVGTISTSACEWRVLFGAYGPVETLRRVSCTNIFSKPNDR